MTQRRIRSLLSMFATRLRIGVLTVAVVGTTAAIPGHVVPLRRGVRVEPQARMVARPQGASVHMPFISRTGGSSEGSAPLYAPISGGSVAVNAAGEVTYAFRRARGASPVVLTETLVGAAAARVSGAGRSPARINIFHGSDPSTWRRDVRAYDRVSLGDVYDGVDATLRAYGGSVEKIFSVRPGAAPARIRLRLAGASHAAVTAAGVLSVDTAGGVVAFTRPVAYQDVDGRRTLVDVAYRLDGLEYGFDLGTYDRTRELIIDPLVSATYLGGSGVDFPWSVAVDELENVYVAGETQSPDFPGIGPGSADSSIDADNVYDAFVAKLDPQLGTLVAATFLGGSGYEGALTVSPHGGAVYAAGFTTSSDFPGVSPASADSTFVENEAWVARLDADLSSVTATFLGGSDEEIAAALAFDASGNVYVGGSTQSSDFPFISGISADQFQSGGEGFIVKLDPTLASALNATFLGGSAADNVVALAIDAAGNVYAAGTTHSSPFPGINPALSADATSVGSEAFVAKLNGALGAVINSTFVGGSGADGAQGLALDPFGAVYLAGDTESPDLPGISGASADSTFAGGAEAFVARLNGGLGAIEASSFLGGSGFDSAVGLVLAETGDVYVAGQTSSSDFPGVAKGSVDATFEVEEAFVARFDPNLSSIGEATYLGGSGTDYALSIARGVSGDLFVAGGTDSHDFPGVTAASADHTAQALDSFVVRLSGLTNPILLLLEKLKGLVAICRFCPPDPGHRLREILDDAIKQVRKDHVRPAINQLELFVRTTARYADKGQLSREDAERFTALANEALAALGAGRVTELR